MEIPPPRGTAERAVALWVFWFFLIGSSIQEREIKNFLVSGVNRAEMEAEKTMHKRNVITI